MNPAPLQIGDEVEVVGKLCSRFGERFKITDIQDTDLGRGHADDQGHWYASCNLRKVRIVGEDELRIGDEVEIIGQNVHNNSMRLGQHFVIEQIIIDSKLGTMYSAPGQLGFPASSLRKLVDPPINSPENQWIEKAEKRISILESKLADLSPKDRQSSSEDSPLSKDELAEYWRNQAVYWQAGGDIWTIDISRGNIHMRNSGRDGRELGEWAKRMMQGEEK